MSRSFKSTREFVPVELPSLSAVPQNSTGFLGIVAKFGPLLIAIIAVAFCFYIYKKVLEMDKIPNNILQAFIQDQTNTNFQIQESYNVMVEQFNTLSGVVHTALVKNGTIHTQLSPSPSIINDSLINDEVNRVDETTENSAPVPDPLPDPASVSAPANEILDDISEVSVSLSSSSNRRRGRKQKTEVNF